MSPLPAVPNTVRQASVVDTLLFDVGAALPSLPLATAEYALYCGFAVWLVACHWTRWRRAAP